MNTTIWRLELEDGSTGAYQAHAIEYAIVRSGWKEHYIDHPCYKKPSPWDDKGLRDRWGTLQYNNAELSLWVFGFASLAQYLRWFEGARIRSFLSEFRTNGNQKIVLRCYRVPQSSTIMSYHQAIFIKRASTVVGERCPAYR